MLFLKPKQQTVIDAANDPRISTIVLIGSVGTGKTDVAAHISLSIAYSFPRTYWPVARHELLAEATGLNEETLQTLRPEHGLSLDQADHMIENAVGIIGIPVGIACNFMINGRVPMATEESSVVAAASKRGTDRPSLWRILHLEQRADHAGAGPVSRRQRSSGGSAPPVEGPLLTDRYCQ
jgi:hypothetical protein